MHQMHAEQMAQPHIVAFEQKVSEIQHLRAYNCIFLKSFLTFDSRYRVNCELYHIRMP